MNINSLIPFDAIIFRHVILKKEKKEARERAMGGIVGFKLMVETDEIIIFSH